MKNWRSNTFSFLRVFIRHKKSGFAPNGAKGGPKMAAKTYLKTVLTISLFLVVLAVSVTAQAKIIYVDDDATGANDGSSWTDAFNYLQDALMFASSGDEIRVAQGIYKPDDFVLSDRPNLGREETFQLKNVVAIQGGYAGVSEPDPNEREIYECE